MRFGERVRQLRHKKGLTLRDLARKVGVDFTYLSKIENGKVEYTPSEKTIRTLARALDAEELELLKLAKKVAPELEAIAGHVSARDFLRKASQTLSSPEDWEDLLAYLDKRHAERQGKTKNRSRKP